LESFFKARSANHRGGREAGPESGGRRGNETLALRSPLSVQGEDEVLSLNNTLLSSPSLLAVVVLAALSAVLMDFLSAPCSPSCVHSAEVTHCHHEGPSDALWVE